MNLEYIREFCALADVKKFSEAAEIAYVSQSSLSKHIKKLEAELGSPLFVRTAHNVVLTEFGEAFLPYAKQLGEIHLKCYNNLLNKVAAESQNVSLGISSLVPLNHLFENIATDSLSELDYSLNIIMSQNKRLRQLLITGKCKFIITTNRLDSDDDEFNVLDFLQDSLCVILSGESAHAAKDPLPLTSLKKLTFVQIGNDELFQEILPLQKRPEFQVPDLSTALNLVRQTKGYTICPSILAQDYIKKSDEDFIIKSITPDHPVNFYLIYNKADLLNIPSHHVYDFIELVKKNLHETDITLLEEPE